MTRPLLIAGIGNMFLGDDAFGCEVARRLSETYPRLRDGVELRDFGVRVRALGYELAARTAGRSGGTIVMVDAVTTGAPPGTVQLFDLAATQLHSWTSVVHHTQGLEHALHTACALGASLEGSYLLGCEPACFEPALSMIAGCLLTPHVEAAAQRCVGLLGHMIEEPDQDLVTLCRT
jgi:hydrogenase maturation protease